MTESYQKNLHLLYRLFENNESKIIDMNTQKKIIKVGIMSLESFKRYTIAIAKGEYKPKKHEPKIWFHSAKFLVNALSEQNYTLLKLIITETPPTPCI